MGLGCRCCCYLTGGFFFAREETVGEPWELPLLLKVGERERPCFVAGSGVMAPAY